MIELSTARAEGYLRALGTAVHALAPGDECVPAAAVLHHLEALRPSLSGDVLGPWGADVGTGMPTFDWMQRASAEAALAFDDDDPSEQMIRRAETLDPALGRRMRDRTRLHGHLRSGPVLPVRDVVAALVTRSEVVRFRVHYDRLLADGRWLRLMVEIELDLPLGSEIKGPLRMDGDTRVVVDDGVRHLLSRHLTSPLGVFVEQVEAGLDVTIPRCSRGIVGPFWFPGVRLPEGVPAELGAGLLLHETLEVADIELRTVGDDPWAAPEPPGRPVHRERRFAADIRTGAALRAWGERLGRPLLVRTF